MISLRNLDPKLVIGFVLGAIALLIMGAAAWNLGEPRWLNCLVSLFGGLLGWWFGIFASPPEQGERRPFSSAIKAMRAANEYRGSIVKKVAFEEGKVTFCGSNDPRERTGHVWSIEEPPL